MAEVACSFSILGEQPEVERRLDRALQVFWEKLEASLSPVMVPDTRKHTHLSRTKLKKAQPPRAPIRPVGRKL
ncbi:Hypothetical predicted protein [Pelobates cultripes]|uniref:Uncharacterized protein n=1 Tax=Pelobates cultripes TaxID=61616 RepID=A0AAD1TJQ7_PELCU|nr:Hypothetical predicted protein [Pelobates cultripes]